jgi:Raf kinase inhibitor-like YbhB/YbcL family protein
MMWAITAALVVSACGSIAVTPDQTQPLRTDEGRTADMPFSLSSSAFEEGGQIPVDNTCDGANRPIPLSWGGVPEGTAELALVMDDPTARGFVHWVVVGIPPDATGIQGDLPAGATEGKGSFARAGYGGPCPPSGTHTYDFTLYALSAPLNLSGTPTADQVRSAAADKTIAQAKLSGKYTRQR